MNCKNLQPRLSEYIDNRLSARETWELDRHLAACNECARVLNEMRRTVALVVTAARREVSQEFMANLQSRLAGVEPRPARGIWLASLAELFRPRVLPAWGAGLATAALALVLLIPHGGQNNVRLPVTPSLEPPVVQSAARQNLAIQATDPLGDLGATNLAAHVAAGEGIAN